MSWQHIDEITKQQICVFDKLYQPPTIIIRICSTKILIPPKKITEIHNFPALHHRAVRSARGCRPRLLISPSNAICLRVAWTRHMRSDLFGKHGKVNMAAMTKCLAWNMPIAQHPYLITNQLSPKIPPFGTTQCWSEVYPFLPTNEHVHKKNESARTISIEPLSNQYQPYCLLL